MITLEIARLVLALSLSMINPTNEMQTLTIGENCYVVDIEEGQQYNNEKISYVTYEDVTDYWD